MMTMGAEQHNMNIHMHDHEADYSRSQMEEQKESNIQTIYSYNKAD